jgi:hypothetical protein
MARLKRLGLGIGLGWLRRPAALAERDQFRDVGFIELLRLNDPAQRVALPRGAVV